MIDFVFTLDYEIYGNGTGALRELVYEPAEELRKIFQKWNARFVNFTEVSEFERIESENTDPAIDLVRKQIREMYDEGFEIGLHLHPQWYKARYENGQWILNSSEYNLCTLPLERITEIVGRGLCYLRGVLGQPDFTPLAFRAGNWLFQPTKNVAAVLVQNGIRVDSSVFKGGVQHNHRLDYRRSLSNGYFWSFADDVNVPVVAGQNLEIPIHSEMVPVWKMTTSKRVRYSGNLGIAGQSLRRKINRVRDLMRFRYPLKLDFCRMTFEELTTMTERVIRQDEQQPNLYRPIVTIGHTKDLTDPATVDAFLAYLQEKGVAVCTFDTVLAKAAAHMGSAAISS
jgi:hypothetical protein